MTESFGTTRKPPAGVEFFGVAAGRLVALTFVAAAIVLPGSPRLHTAMETVANFAAVFAGIISLARHQTRDDNIFLLIPSIFFALALVGYASTGSWKRVSFVRCLVASLMLGLVAQVCVMLRSESLFGGMFDAAQLLKTASYLVVAAGLMACVYLAFADIQRLTAERQPKIV